MNILKRTVFLLLLALSGAVCAANPASPPGVQASGSAGLACPARDFSDFIKLFSESSAVQEKFTRFPLEKLQLNRNVEPEPQPFTRTLGRNQLDFPIIPPLAERQKYDLDLQIMQYGPDRVTLRLQKPESDAVLEEYYFVLDSCWYLVRIEDRSL